MYELKHHRSKIFHARESRGHTQITAHRRARHLIWIDLKRRHCPNTPVQMMRGGCTGVMRIWNYSCRSIASSVNPDRKKTARSISLTKLLLDPLLKNNKKEFLGSAFSVAEREFSGRFFKIGLNSKRTARGLFKYNNTPTHITLFEERFLWKNNSLTRFSFLWLVSLPKTQNHLKNKNPRHPKNSW